MKYTKKFTKNKTKILHDYIKGATTRTIQKKYSVSFKQLSYYVKSKNVHRDKSAAMKLRAKLNPIKLSEEHKKKISRARKKYLNEHPDQIPYLLYHAKKGMSRPEKRFYNILNKMGIKGWIYNYPNGRYLYDFGFPLLKLDIEIDGKQHLSSQYKIKDEIRDRWSISKGWKVLRFTSDECYLNLSRCIDKMLCTINNIDPLYDLYDIHKKWDSIKKNITPYRVNKIRVNKIRKKETNKKIFMPLSPISCKCFFCGCFFDTRRKHQKFCSISCAAKLQPKKVKNRPLPVRLIQEIKSTNFSKVAKKYNVSRITIRKWCKSYNIDMNIFKKKVA